MSWNLEPTYAVNSKYDLTNVVNSQPNSRISIRQDTLEHSAKKGYVDYNYTTSHNAHQQTGETVKNLIDIKTHTHKPRVSHTMILPLLENQEKKKCPFGLEYLHSVDQLIIKVSLDFIKKIDGSYKPHIYEITNIEDETMYTTLERSEFWEQECCSSDRGFSMLIMCPDNIEVIQEGKGIF